MGAELAMIIAASGRHLEVYVPVEHYWIRTVIKDNPAGCQERANRTGIYTDYAAIVYGRNYTIAP